MAELLYPLALLACPIGMGLMMFFMMRGNKSDTTPSRPASADELTRLRAEVDQLRVAQNHSAVHEAAAEPGERR